MPFGSLSNVLEIKSAEGFRGSSVLQQSYPLTGYATASAAPAFSPLSLFTGGIQGVWYDPSDLTTMFTDSAGTTPVGTPGNGSAQPVGLLLDKSQNAVGTNGAACYNRLLSTEDFSNTTYWTNSFGTSTRTGGFAAPDSTLTAWKLVFSGSNAEIRSSSTFPTSGMSATIWMKGTAGETIAWLGSNAGVVTFDGTWQKFQVNSISQTYFWIGTWNGATARTIYVWHPDVRATADLASTPTYQPITSSWAATMAGNHATQSTASARPELSAKYNLLTYSQQFTNAVWTKTATVVDNAATDPIGGNTAATLTPTSATNNQAYIHPYTSAVPSGTATAVIHLKKNVARYGYAWIADNSFNTYGVAIDLNNGAFVAANPTGSPTGTSYSITDVGNGWYRLSLSGVGLFAYLVVECSSSSPTFSGNHINNSTNGEGVYIWGADLRASNDGVGLPAYQRVVDANTYDSVGFPYYLNFNGVQTIGSSNIDFTATNKMSVFHGIRRTSTSGTQYLSTISNDWYNNNGTWVLAMYPNSNAVYFASKGTSPVNTGSTVASPPATNVMTMLSDIGSPYVTARFNGSQISTSTGSQGTGNYGNYPLWISSNNSSNMTAQRMYGLITRGAASTATEITNAENWLNTKIKAY